MTVILARPIDVFHPNTGKLAGRILLYRYKTYLERDDPTTALEWVLENLVENPNVNYVQLATYNDLITDRTFNAVHAAYEAAKAVSLQKNVHKTVLNYKARGFVKSMLAEPLGTIVARTTGIRGLLIDTGTLEDCIAIEKKLLYDWRPEDKVILPPLKR